MVVFQDGWCPLFEDLARLQRALSRRRPGVELPIPPQTFGTFKHRSMPNGQVGITLDTIMFTLFYPTEPATAYNPPATWFPR